MVLLHRTLHRSLGRVLRCPGRRIEGRPLSEQGPADPRVATLSLMVLCYTPLPKLLHQGPAEKLSDTQVAALKI